MIGVGVSFVLVFLEMQALNQTSVMESPTASHGVELALLDEDSMNIYNVILGSLGTVRRGDAAMDGLGGRRETSCRSTNCSQKTAALSTNFDESPTGVDDVLFFQDGHTSTPKASSSRTKTTLFETPRAIGSHCKSSTADDWLRHLIGTPLTSMKSSGTAFYTESSFIDSPFSLASDDRGGAFHTHSSSSELFSEELTSLKSVVLALEKQNLRLCTRLTGFEAASTKRTSGIQAMEPSIGNEDALTLKTRLAALICQNDQLMKQIDDLKLEDEHPFHEFVATYSKPVESPKMMYLGSHSTEEKDDSRDEEVVMTRKPRDDSNEARDEGATTSTTTEKLSFANEMEILRTQLASTKAQLNDATIELTKAKQQNKQLETAAHVLSLELITEYKTEEIKDVSSLNDSSDANNSNYNMFDGASDLGAASIWIVDNSDIILNW